MPPHGGVSVVAGLSFLLGFFFEATLGMVGFWILEVSSLLFVYQLFSFFFSGQMFRSISCRAWAGRSSTAADPVHGAIFRGRFSGKDHGPRPDRGPGRAGRLGRVLHGGRPEWRLPATAFAPI